MANAHLPVGVVEAGLEASEDGNGYVQTRELILRDRVEATVLYCTEYKHGKNTQINYTSKIRIKFSVLLSAHNLSFSSSY